MPLNNHNIDFEKLVTDLLGRRHRKPKRIAWLTALVAGIKNIHAKFLAFTDKKLDEVKYNGQNFIMEKMLQDKFGPGIYIITNLGSIDGMTIGDGSDLGSGIGSGSDFYEGIGESFLVAGTNFTVYVPSALTFVPSEMEAYVRKYKLFGKTFNIVIF